MAEQLSLTLAWLQRSPHRACEEARTAFAERWPGGVAPISEVLLALADHPQGLEWWEWLASWRWPARAPLWEQYVAALKSVDEQYQAARKPLMEQYRAARKLIYEQYRAARKLIYEQYEAARKPLWEQYVAACKPLREQYRAARRDILRRLAVKLEGAA